MTLGLGLKNLALSAPNLKTGGGWWQRGASIDLDFAGNRIFGAPSFTSALAITRASAGYAQDGNGLWLPFASGELRRANGTGLLLEEARTNSIRNNSMQGAVAGSPGTLPTNWFVGNARGLTISVAQVTTQSGIDTARVSLAGTPTSSGRVGLFFDASTTLAAVQGNKVAVSAFLALVAGALTNISSVALQVDEYSSTPTFLTTTGGSALSVDSALGRKTSVLTIASATAATVQPVIAFTVTNGQPVNATFDIGWPQLELGAFATSPIRTTSAAATRAADVITLNNPTNYVSSQEGSVCAEWEELIGATGSIRYLFSYRIDASNSIRMYVDTDNKVHCIVYNGNVLQCDLVSANTTVFGQRYKCAFAWESNRFAMRCTSSLGSPANDASGTPPTGTPVFGLGNHNGGVTGAINDRRLTLFSEPLTDAQLEALVA
jgi:hypothetical protein